MDFGSRNFHLFRLVERGVGKKLHDMRVARASSSRRVRAVDLLARRRKVVSQGAADRTAANDDDVVVSGHGLFSLLGRGR